MASLRWLACLSLIWLAKAPAQIAPALSPGIHAWVPPAGLNTPDLSASPPADDPSQPLSLDALPDSPGAILHAQQATDPQHGDSAKSAHPDPCPQLKNRDANAPQPAAQPCKAQQKPQNPYRPFLNSSAPIPLSPRQKAYLAFRDVTDPFNLLTIGLNSAFTVAIDAHNPYDPGIRGFAWDSLYSLSQDATGEAIGTFGVCSLLHEDPHYHRMAHGRPLKRFLYAISRTWVAQRDDGQLMPNYEKFVVYPASAEISNLYVPGVNGNGPSTFKRVTIGLLTDPADNLITEFLPDFASRIHVHIVFLQQIVNQVAAGQL